MWSRRMSACAVGRRMSVYLQPIARLKPGVSVEQAQAQMDQIARALQATHPVWNQGTNIGVRPLVDHLVGARMKSWMFMLLGAVGLVLLIACANVANLVLARATAYRSWVFAALGASGDDCAATMVRSILLSSLVAILAIALAWCTIPIVPFHTSNPGHASRPSRSMFGARCARAALATGVFFGTYRRFSSRGELTRCSRGTRTPRTRRSPWSSFAWSRDGCRGAVTAPPVHRQLHCVSNRSRLRSAKLLTVSCLWTALGDPRGATEASALLELVARSAIIQRLSRFRSGPGHSARRGSASRHTSRDGLPRRSNQVISHGE